MSMSTVQIQSEPQAVAEQEKLTTQLDGDDIWNAKIAESARRNLQVDHENNAGIDYWKDHWNPDATRASSRKDFIEENGLRYHSYNAGKYFLPNNDTEQARLDLQHKLFLLSLNDRLHLAPIGDHPEHVLDIGTGTGIWAIEFARKYPTSKVIGTDLSPMTPSNTPSNTTFMTHDAEDPWNFPHAFDFIHGRALLSCFQSPPAVIASAFAALARGGHLEFQDMIMPMRGIDASYTGSANERTNALTLEAARRLGKDWTHSNRYEQYFRRAGFVDVVVHHFEWPMGTWPRDPLMKRIGSGFQMDCVNSNEGFTMALWTRGLGMSEDEVRRRMAENRECLLDPNMHSYMPGVVVYGRKP